MRREQLSALAEVAAVELCFLVVAWLLQAINPSGYGWYSKSFMIFLGLLGIFAHGKPGEYGLKPKSLGFSAKWSAYVIAIFALTSVVVLLAAVAAGILVALEPTALLTMLVWYYLFVGFAEELFFRGYVQSRLNEVFAKKYERFLGVDFEWTQGTLVTAIFFFGLPHLLTGINPFTGTYRVGPLVIAIAVFAMVVGLVLGVLREKTGCILVPTALHGSLVFTTFALGKAIGLAASNAVAAIALFVFFALFLGRMLREPVA